MNNQDKNLREFKKQQLKNKLTINAQSSFLVTWWLDIAYLINRTGCKWELEYLDVVTEDQYHYWIEKLVQEPWSKFSFPNSVIVQGENYGVHEMFYSRYPSTLPLRYLPSSEIVQTETSDTTTILKTMINENGLNNQDVYLFYIRMSPVIKMELYDIFALSTQEILPDHEDVAIMALDGSWLIYKSIEQEWLFEKSNIK
jgi:hypothetical protein